MTISPSFVWFTSDPPPPPLAAGWSYVAPWYDWLFAESPEGRLYFVAHHEGEYRLFPRCVAGADHAHLAVGDVYADSENTIPLPTAEGRAE